MIDIGDHVYHTEVEANGIVTEIDENKKKDKYKVVFQWAKYCEAKHGAWRGMKRADRKWQYAREESLTKLDMPIDLGGLGQHKVTMIGGRSLDRLFRHMTGIKRRKPRDGSDIVINYGASNTRVPNSVFMLNRNLIMDKYRQMKIMGEDLCPRSMQNTPHDKENWIIKPYHSIGGKGIRPAKDKVHGVDVARHGEYYQQMFNKVREFRAHCFLWEDNPVPFIQEKVIENPNQLTWNKKQGGKFRYVYQEGLDYGKFYGMDEDLIERIRELSVTALKRLGYDFGGLDFGLAGDGTLRIFEVNSRMGLRERSFFTYKQVFNNLRRINYRRDF
jgi:hypothetical protein